MTEGTGVRTPAPQSAASADAVPVGRYGAFLRRNKTVVAIALALGVAGAGLRLGFTERTYTSTVAIFAPPVALHSGAALTASTITPDLDDQRPPRESTMDTEAQLALSDKSLTRLSKVRGFRIERERLKKRISVTVPTYTRVLSIKVRAHTAEEARDGARTLAKSYLALRKEIVAGIQQHNQETLQRNLSLLRAQLRAIDGRTTDIARLTARGRQQILTKQIGVVQRQLAQNNDKTAQAGEVVHSADLSPEADGSRADVVVSTGLGLGLLGGLLLGLVQDRRPRRVRSLADLRRAVTLPVLAEVRDGPDGLRDACRRLRNVVHEEEAGAILLTGIPGAAADPMARMLARVCVQGGTSTTILRVGVDRDERGDGRWDRRRDGPPGSGGVAGAGTRADTEGHVRAADGDEIDVRTIPPGGERQLSAALRKARREADLVVVTGSALRSPETTVFAAACDLTFLAVELGRITANELVSGTAYLADAAAPPRGLVLTRPTNHEERL
jgi:capsular polysaccharide biosynthesis protein